MKASKMEIKIGLYKHYKGNYYWVMYNAKHSETLEDLVVYQARYGEQGLWVRPAIMFNEMVMVDGKEVLRFEYVQDHLDYFDDPNTGMVTGQNTKIFGGSL